MDIIVFKKKQTISLGFWFDFLGKNQHLGIQTPIRRGSIFMT